MKNKELFIDGYKLPQPLSKDETNRLLKEVSEGSTTARQLLAVHNIRFVIKEVLNTFATVEYDKDELVSIGNIGLLKAIDNYDLTKGVNFLTYTVRCIDNEILMFLRKLTKARNTDSLEKVIGNNEDGSETKLKDILSTDNDLLENKEKIETYKAIREIVKNLPKTEKEIIMLYFGFYDDQVYTQKEIAEALHLSQSYVSRVIKRAVEQIGMELQSREFIELSKKKKKQPKGKNNGIQSIYEYFEEYTKEQINDMLAKLSSEEIELVKLRYGEDLEKPVRLKLKEEYKNKFYGYLLPRMKKMLANPDVEFKRVHRDPKNKKNNLSRKKPISQILELNNNQNEFLTNEKNNQYQLVKHTK